MPWTDPTDYAANAVPTTSGAETLNFNTKVTSKLRQLYQLLTGSDTAPFILKAGSTQDVKVQLSDAAGAQFFTLLDSSGGTIVQVDSKGQLRNGPIDAEVLGVQFPGQQIVTNKINNVRLLVPYTFKATELTLSCDDTMGVGSSGTLTYVALSNGTAFGTASITPGNSTATTVFTARTLSKNQVITFNCTVIGGGTAPGQDINAQVRGYRSGTIIL